VCENVSVLKRAGVYTTNVPLCFIPVLSTSVSEIVCAAQSAAFTQCEYEHDFVRLCPHCCMSQGQQGLAASLRIQILQVYILCPHCCMSQGRQGLAASLRSQNYSKSASLYPFAHIAACHKDGKDWQLL